MDVLNIYDQSGQLRLSTPPNEGAVREIHLGGEDFAEFPINVATPIAFKVGDYADIPGEGRFYICEVPEPAYNTDTSGFAYKIRLEPQYRIWRNKRLMLHPARGGESSWSLTDTLPNHLNIILENLKYHGFKYHDPSTGNDEDYIYSVDSDIAEVSKLVTYSCDILSGLQLIAEIFECSVWVDEKTIRFGKCEHGEEEILIRRNNEASDIKPSGTDTSLPTRLFAFGGSDNVPPWYRKELVFKATKVVGNLVYDERRPIRTSMFPAQNVTPDPSAVRDIQIWAGETKQWQGSSANSWYHIFSRKSDPVRFIAATWTFSIKTFKPYVTLSDFSNPAHDGIAGNWRYKCTLSISGMYKKHHSDGSEEDAMFVQTFNGKTDYSAQSAHVTFAWDIEEIKRGLPADMDLTASLDVYISCVNDVQGSFKASVTTYGQKVTATRLSYNSVKNLTITPKDGSAEITGVGFNTDHAPETGILPLILPEGQTIPVGTEFYLNPIRKANIPSAWWTAIASDSVAVTDAIASKRLCLPIAHPYIDYREGQSDIEAIEDVVTFDEIIPKQNNTVNNVWMVETRSGNDDGSSETVMYWCIMSDALQQFDNSCILSGATLSVKFTSGVLNGMQFGVKWHQYGIYQSNGNPCFEIVMNEDYGRKLPDSILCPAKGDSFVLLGFDVELLAPDLISDAEQELFDRANKYLIEEHIKGKTYDCPLNDSFLKVHGIPKLGQRVKLHAPDLFPGGNFSSKVVAIKYCMDIPEDNPVITVGEMIMGSRLSSVESTVETVSQVIDSGGFLTKSEAEQMYMKLGDTVPESDTGNSSDISPDIEYKLQQYINGKGFLTEHQDISHLLEKSVFEKLSSEVNGLMDHFYPVDESGNKLAWSAENIHAIKAVKTLYSAQGVSARGLSETQAGGGTGGSSTLGALTDVTLGTLKSGDALVYDGTKWTNQPVKVGINETELANYLSANRYAKLSDIPSLDGCVQKSGDTMSGTLQVQSVMIGWSNEINVAGGDRLCIGYRETGNGVNLCYNNAPLTYGSSGVKIWHENNDGPGSGLDADMLDGQHSSSFLRIVGEASSNGLDSPWTYPAIKPYYNCLPDGDGISNAYGYGEVVSFGADPYSMRFEFYCSYQSSNDPSSSSAGLYFRSGWSDEKKPWRRLATVDGNIRTASYLQYGRTLWGQYFNGGDNVSGDMSGVGLITFANGQEIYCPSGEFNLNLNSGTRLLTGTATGVAIGYSSPRYKLDVRGSLIADGWLRTTGAAGWYSEDYGGGWYMQGGTYIENYGDKRVKLTGPQSYYDLWLAGGGICCEGNTGWGWNAGYGCLNAGIADNSAQTPLIVAYRNGAVFENGEAGRLFSMELLNDGSQVWLNFGGTNRFKFWSTGELFAQAGVWSNGYISARGQNTGSDIRLKDILGDCPLTVEQVAGLPAVRFRWKDNGTVAVGTIAQDVRKVLPELVTERPQDGMLGVDYGVLGYLSAHAVAVKVMEHESRLERIEKLLGITE